MRVFEGGKFVFLQCWLNAKRSQPSQRGAISTSKTFLPPTDESGTAKQENGCLRQQLGTNKAQAMPPHFDQVETGAPQLIQWSGGVHGPHSEGRAVRYVPSLTV
jgi:hypothetical protein